MPSDTRERRSRPVLLRPWPHGEDMPPRLTDERPQGDIFLSLEMVLSCDAARHEPESALGQQLPLRTGCPAGGAAGHQPSRDLISRGSGRTRGPVGTCPPCGCRWLGSLPPQDDTKSAPGEGVTELTEATDQGRPTDSKATAENNSLWPRFGGDLPPRNWNGPAFQPAPSAPKDSEWYGSYKGGGAFKGNPTSVLCPRSPALSCPGVGLGPREDLSCRLASSPVSLDGPYIS